MARERQEGGAVGALQGAHSASGQRGRFSARRKQEAVLRLVRGEDLDSLSRELGVTGATLSQWRDRFLTAGEAALKSRAADRDEGERQRLKAKLGEVLMDNELLQDRIDRRERGRPLARRRSSR